MNEYDANSCNALEKAFYTPLEAAIRWCNLTSQEEYIIEVAGGEVIPNIKHFPQWPCLRANVEKIIDAINHKQIPHGRDGKTVHPDDHVAVARRTVRHSDLRQWMIDNYPSQKPAFLFDENERNTHTAFNADSFRALQADLEASRSDLQQITKRLHSMQAMNEELMGENTSLRALVESSNPPGERAETTYLNIIGALLELLLVGKSSSGKPYSPFETQDAIIEILLAYHENKQGIAVRTLQEKFAAAKRSLHSS